MLGDWVSVEEAAARARRSKRRIYEWIAEGKVKTIRPGRQLWVHLPDVLKVEAEQKIGRPRRGELR